MLKSTVPTPLTTPVRTGGLASASSTKTSSSGSEKATEGLQLRPISSSQCPVPGSNWTISPVLGAPGVEPGGGGGRPPLAATTCSVIVVVRFPESSTAANTAPPSGLAASARGGSPKSCTIASGVPPSAAPGVFALNTHTPARPPPAVGTPGPPARALGNRFRPRRAQGLETPPCTV